MSLDLSITLVSFNYALIFVKIDLGILQNPVMCRVDR